MAASGESPRTAVLFLTHRFDAFCLDGFDRLRSQGPKEWDYRILCEEKPELAANVGDRPLYRFRFADLLARGYRPVAPKLVPGSTHFGLFHFAAAYPEFERLWQVEYDVHFSGNWGDFFAAHETDADLLTSHVRRQADEPAWGWWRTLAAPRGVNVPARLRGFHPIFRLSHRAFRYLDACFRDGWRGHYEVTLPTLLHDVGMKLEEFGGEGPFVRAGNEGRFYPPSEARRDGDITGTMRWRPEWTRDLTRPNTLYHPVKTSPA
jgi:hypothetical protein